MELTQLRYLLALNRTRNFSRAAQELYITQPTLSQQIKKLEDELGVALFTRNTRSVTPTRAGEQCCLYAAQAIEAVDQIGKVAKEARRRASGHIQLGMLAVYPQLNIPHLLARFSDEHPDVQIGLQFALSIDLLKMLVNKDVDVIISNIAPETIDPVIREQIHFTVFLNDRLHVILSKKHPLAAQESLTIDDICQDTFFCTDGRASVKLLFDHTLKQSGYTPITAYSCPSMTALFNYVGANMGVSVLTKHVATAYQTDEILCLPIIPEIPTQTAIIIRKNAVTHPLVKEFTQYFLENIEGI